MNEAIMRALGFDKEVDRVSLGFCPCCQKEIKLIALDFRDEKSRKEFKISGMCQECQDKTFKEEDEE